MTADGQLGYHTLYPLLRQHISDENGRFWKIRSWSLALTGGVYTMALAPALGLERTISWQAAIWVAVAGSVMNLALWILGLSVLRGVYTLGTYLSWIEKREGLAKGWELYVAWRYRNRPEPAFLRLAYDVHTWLALSYVVFFIFAARFGNHLYAYGAAVLAIALLSVGSFSSMDVQAYRDATASDLCAFVGHECDAAADAADAGLTQHNLAEV